MAGKRREGANKEGSETRRSGRGGVKKSQGVQTQMEGWTVCVSGISNETERDKEVNKGRLAGKIEEDWVSVKEKKCRGKASGDSEQ